MTMDSTMRQSHLYEQLPATQYESDYAYPKIVEESPSIQRLLPVDSVTFSEDGSMASGAAMRTAHPCFLSQMSGQSASYVNSYRKRQNPLYQSISRLDTKSSNSQLCHLGTCSTVLLSLLAVFACLLSLISIGIAINGNKNLPPEFNVTYVENLEMRLKTVLENYDFLAKQVNEMKQENIQFQNLQSEMSNDSKVLRIEMSRMQNVISQQIVNISRLPGPRGPPGLANMAACTYANRNTGSSAAMPVSTDWVPRSRSELETIGKITGVECSASSGSAAYLNVSQAEDFVQYRCLCLGSNGQGSASRHCFIHFWSCPVDS